MVKRVICLLFTVIIGVNVFSQETVTAEKELLTKIPVGTKENEVAFLYTEEGMWTPGAPEVDNKGNIYLFSHSNENILRYSAGKLETLPYPSDYPMEYVINPNGYPATSQEGIYGYSWHSNELVEKLRGSITLEKIARNEILYMMPWGVAIQYSDYRGNSQVLGITYDPMTFSNEKDIKRTYTGYTVSDLKTWLPTQPEGFSIGDDGLLYRNGMVWSAKQPDGYPGKYLGRLASGHAIWGSDSGVGVRRFYITNSKGEIEADLHIPWASDEKRWSQSEGRPYNYGIGPWGEIYCLIPPPYKAAPGYVAGPDTLEFFTPDPNGTAELVVVRNHLKYFGRLNDDKVRLRKGPSTSTESLGTYPVKTGFRILEKGTAEETIGGQKNVWYKVRLLDGTEGWFFGAFVHNLYDGPNGNPPPWPNVADW